MRTGGIWSPNASLFGEVRRPRSDSGIVSATLAPPNLPPMPTRFNAAFTALLAAALFGATTPLAKALLGSLSPFLLAGLFYLGSGTGLAAVILARRLKGQADGQPTSHHRFPVR